MSMIVWEGATVIDTTMVASPRMENLRRYDQLTDILIKLHPSFINSFVGGKFLSMAVGMPQLNHGECFDL